MNTRNRIRRVSAFLLPLLLPLGLAAQTASSASEETVKLNPFEVTAGSDKGYGALNNMAGMRVNGSSMDEPTSVITINKQLMDDIAPEQPIDAVQWVSGVNNTIGEYSTEFTVRGFQLATYDFVDGLPGQGGVSGDDFQDMAPIERVEIVKGPAGVQFGSTSLGGVVDFITKKPLPYNQTILNAAYGSWNTFRTTVDTNVVGGPQNKINFRIIIDYQHGQNPLGGPQGQKDIQPTLYYHISDTATIWSRFEYIFTDSMYGLTSVIADNHSNLSTFHNFFVPIKDVSGTPSKEFKYKYEVGASGAFELAGAVWNVRAIGRLSKFWFDGDETNLTGVNFINAAGGVINTIANGGFFGEAGVAGMQLTRLERFEDDHGSYSNGDVDFVAQYDWSHTRDVIDIYNYVNFNYFTNHRIAYTLPAEDLLHIVQSPNIFAQITGLNGTGPAIKSESESVGYAAGMQDNLQLFDDRVILVGGARWDWGWQSATNYLVTTNLATTGGTDDAWSDKLGAIVKPIPSVKGFAVFWDRSTTFQPQTGFLNNNPLTPTKSLTGVMDEGGVKLDLFNGRLTGTASAFSGSLNNNIIKPPDVNGVSQLQIQQGVQKTTGWEGDLAVEPIPQVALIVAYSNLVSKDPNGAYTRDVAEGASYKALGKYTFLDGPLAGFGAGYGYIFVSKHAGIAGATFVLPSYNYSTAFLTYTQKTWRVQLNVNNVTNKAYAAGSTSNYEIYPGNPREIKLSVTYLIK